MATLAAGTPVKVLGRSGEFKDPAKDVTGVTSGEPSSADSDSAWPWASSTYYFVNLDDGSGCVVANADDVVVI